MAAAACAALLLPGAWVQVGIIGVAALAGMALLRPAPAAPEQAMPTAITRRAGSAWLALFFALLIGRAAQGRPWIFREIVHFLETGEPLPAPQLGEVEQILLEHLSALHAFYGEHMGIRIARKHVGWYLASLPGARDFRGQFNRLESMDEQCANVRQFFAERHNNGEEVAA